MTHEKIKNQGSEILNPKCHIFIYSLRGYFIDFDVIVRMDGLNRLLGAGGPFGGIGRGQPSAALGDSPQVDNSEIIYISPLSLLKAHPLFYLCLLEMLKHARAGVPMEVMGLMLGEFVDEYTISVVDVFAMPQSGTGVSVEAVDDAFQTQMMEYLSL